MVQINFARKEINCKIVYYGPGMSGKTTNLEVVHQKTPGENKGELTCIATEGDRTLFFDFMPLNLGNIMGMNIKFQLYTVPGQVYYNSTRKLVLRGVDGVIFIADSAPDKMAENIESLDNLKENLAEYGKDLNDLPMVIQYNKQDLPNALGAEEMDTKLNVYGAPSFPGVASKGEGVFATLKALSAIIIENINQKEDAGTPRGGLTPTPAANPTQPGHGTDRPAGGAATTHPAGAGFVTAATGGEGGTVHPNPGTSHPHHQAAAAHHGEGPGSGPGDGPGASASTETFPDTATTVLEQQPASRPTHHPAPTAAPRGQMEAPVTSRPTAHSRPTTGRTPEQKRPAVRSARSARQMGPRTRHRGARNTPQPGTKTRTRVVTRSRKEPTEAPKDSGKRWRLVLLVVFVMAFAATALVAFLG